MKPLGFGTRSQSDSAFPDLPRLKINISGGRGGSRGCASPAPRSAWALLLLRPACSLGCDNMGAMNLCSGTWGAGVSLTHLALWGPCQPLGPVGTRDGGSGCWRGHWAALAGWWLCHVAVLLHPNVGPVPFSLQSAAVIFPWGNLLPGVLRAVFFAPLMRDVACGVSLSRGAEQVPAR